MHRADIYRVLARLHLQVGNIGIAADLQERRERLCHGCNGNQKYVSAGRVGWCSVCHPEKKQ
jgi:hypothetical protein